jgi:hypothetical protein
MKVKKHSQKTGKVQQKSVSTLKKNVNSKNQTKTVNSKTPQKGKATKN